MVMISNSKKIDVQPSSSIFAVRLQHGGGGEREGGRGLFIRTEEKLFASLLLLQGGILQVTNRKPIIIMDRNLNAAGSWDSS